MKEKRAKLRAKKKLENEKLQLKQERLRLLEEQNEKQRKNIIKKLNKMEKKKLELDKKKDEFYQQIKQGLNMKVQGTKVNKNSLAKEADAKRRGCSYDSNERHSHTQITCDDIIRRHAGLRYRRTSGKQTSDKKCTR